MQRAGWRNYSPRSLSTSATLWSRELVELALKYDVGTSDLSPDLRERMEEREEEAYKSQISFDVFMFVPAARGYSLSDVVLGGAGSRIVLQVDDERFSPPSHISGSDILVGGQSVFQRANHITFPRVVDGHDILDGAEEIRLFVFTSGTPSDELSFTWRITE